MHALAARIKKCRTDAGLSQGALADKLHLDRSAVAQWERDNPIRPTAGHLEEIALATGVSYEWLATGRGPRVIGGEGDEPPGVIMDYIAQSESEERLLMAFRKLSAMDQLPVLDHVESLSRER